MDRGKYLIGFSDGSIEEIFEDKGVDSAYIMALRISFVREVAKKSFIPPIWLQDDSGKIYYVDLKFTLR